ncbi:hypothetical protein [Bradyrhizobium sp. RDI18]|uniref:hypothetical protein n=1 Tax=Bradyrhizobium sp. RDI18 TaxID=3367400 RepID=UPI00372074B5
MTSDKIRYIPNWATLAPGVRAVAPDNPFRRPLSPVSLSVYPGRGMGFDQLNHMQSEAKLPNVMLVDLIEDEQLEMLLSAADVWIIPYRKSGAGVSVPSRF